MYLKNGHFNEIIDEETQPGDFDLKQSQRLSSKAIEFKTGENIAVIYVNTIVFLKIGKKIMLNTASWRTNTTKKWINHGLAIAGSRY